ncbi:TlpA family protein disulfide reductase [Flavobacterium sp.]|uniref:TlpA family protein disulfide reductase n=1 Tax=Flavobacterium sp. TaxID=239 RepID=UPI0039E25339
MKKIVFVLTLCGLLACNNKETATDVVPVTAVPEVAKPTQVYTKEGVRVNSYDFKAFEPFLQMQNDTTYVVNFWATWCTPCVEELPNFEKITSDYKDKKVKVILVSLDFKKQVESNLLPFIERKKLQSQVVHLSDPDANAWISKVDSAWSGAIPATVIYNKDKRKFYEQSFTFDQLQQEIKLFNNQQLQL